MRIGIIGYEGFIGSAMVRESLRRGFKPIGIGRDSCVSRDCDIVIDCNGNSRKYEVNNDAPLGHKSIVESVSNRLTQSEANQLYVYISSGEVYGKEQKSSQETEKINVSQLSTYGRFKFEAEELVRTNRLNHLIIRPSGFVGFGLQKNPIFDLTNNKPLFVATESRFQFCDIDWFAYVVIQLACKKITGVFNVSAKDTISIQEIIAHMNIHFKQTSVNLPIEHHELDTHLIEQYVELPYSKDVVFQYVKKTMENHV